MAPSDSPAEGNEPMSVDQAIEQLDEKANKYHTEGKLVASLTCLEKALMMRKEVYGMRSDVVRAACEKTVIAANSIGMNFLQKENFANALELLKRAEILVEPMDIPGQKATTYNNLACFYRRQGKLRTALKYLHKAIFIEEQAGSRTLADTHLNLCAILSQLGRHKDALHHAQSALILLQEEFFGQYMNSDETPDPKHLADRIAVLVIAYHNTGVEQEFLGRPELCLEAYRKGVEMGETHLGRKHAITVSLRQSYASAKQSISMKTEKSKVRAQLRSASASVSKLDVLRHNWSPQKKRPDTSSEPKRRNNSSRMSRRSSPAGLSRADGSPYRQRPGFTPGTPNSWKTRPPFDPTGRGGHIGRLVSEGAQRSITPPPRASSPMSMRPSTSHNSTYSYSRGTDRGGLTGYSDPFGRGPPTPLTAHNFTLNLTPSDNLPELNDKGGRYASMMSPREEVVMQEQSEGVAA